MYKLSQRSLDNLEGVHPHLVAVVKRAIMYTEVDFAVIEGVRTLERQKELLKAGTTKTLKSRHLTGHAVDIAAYVGGGIRWDRRLYGKINTAMKAAAYDLNVPIEWGGDWKSPKDGPHWQLSWKKYPLTKVVRTPSMALVPEIQPIPDNAIGASGATVIEEKKSATVKITTAVATLGAVSEGAKYVADLKESASGFMHYLPWILLASAVVGVGYFIYLYRRSVRAKLLDMLQ